MLRPGRLQVVFVKRRPKGPPRRSARIGGADVPDYAEVAGDDDDGLVDLLGALGVVVQRGRS